MTIKEYLQYIKLRTTPGVKINLKSFKNKEFGFTYNDIPFYHYNMNIVKSVEDVHKVIELLNFYIQTNIPCFRIINKKAIGKWDNCIIYKTEDVAIGWNEKGVGCYALSNKYIVAEGNKARGFFKSDNFYRVPISNLNIEGMLPDECEFKKYDKSLTEETYPGLLEAFRKCKEKDTEKTM